MTRRPTLVLLALAVSLSACGPTSNTGIGVPFVQIDVAFNGVADCQKAGVTTVVVTFADLALPPQESPCSGASVAVVYQDVAVGKYAATVEGQDAGGNPIYRAQQTIDVELGGPTTFALNLEPVMVTTVPKVQITVTYNGVSDCQAAGVTGATISFANEALSMQAIDCNPSGIAFTYQDVPVGSYSATIEAQGSSGQTIYAGQGMFNVAVGGPTTFGFDLPAKM